MFTLDNITKSYLTASGRKYIFRNLSFTFPADKNIALIGKNGAGKSTLMRLLSGVDAPDSGVIRTDKSISWPVGQAGGFQGSMSARDNVKFVCRVYGFVGEEMRAKVKYVQEFADIGDWFDEPIRTYSSGMKSRIAFGLSMAFDFDYYLIDEVMAAGDNTFRQKCEEVFAQKLVKSKIFLTTHNMREVERLCDLVILVDKGQLIVYDDVQQGIEAYRKK
ncbi:ABC transporter ATP-binding protein [Bordetella sp. 02P26C-1]|uniref:ABC transporter ATP-binding protein n=1 Tax=Bordetella sp. 02P26C-1 TaxID=2683195 RepID=UPI0013554006|nr:ABC transporter ATP-binding protein [Bordetella sp. 02P26C-1]MVW80527.1 ATP-binding cassette domain-containing protein [Bordetella sp. 02P26C-1]